MNNKLLYSISALFNTPEEIIKAANFVADKGYKKFDVNTPYPVDGMNKAMKLKPSKLGYVALVFGLSGTISALFFMYWAAVVDYPIVIGGKPYFAFPAYVPIMFEITVLSAAIATVVTLLFVVFKFPNNAHPLHDTEYMKAVSVDKYGVTIEAEDDLFKEEEVKSLFEKLGAFKIIPVYFDEKELNFKPKIFEPKFLILLTLIAIITSGATYFSLNKLMYLPPFNWMDIQPKITAQGKSDFFKGAGMLLPPEGTVMRNAEYFPFKGKPSEAANNLINPLLPTPKNMELGKNKFNIFCSPCHGYLAEGKGRLQGEFPQPPSLHSNKVKNWKDGRIFYIITEGKNAMPSYVKQLNPEERWAVVLYLRALQRALDARETDLK